MKAGDVRCPECGEGFQDVEEYYEFGPAVFGSIAYALSGKCVNGHRVEAVEKRVDSGLVVRRVRLVEAA